MTIMNVFVPKLNYLYYKGDTSMYHIIYLSRYVCQASPKSQSVKQRVHECDATESYSMCVSTLRNTLHKEEI